MMKKSLISLLVLLLALSGCVYDNYVPDSCKEEEGPFYISFVLNHSGSSSQGTKATAGGTSKLLIAEQLVSKVDIYFYDLDGNYLDRKTIPTPGEEGLESFEQKLTGDSETNISNQVGHFYVKLNYRPARMIMALNLPDAVKFDNKTLALAKEEMQKASLSYAGSAVNLAYEDAGGSDKTENNVTPFFMTSSSYASTGGVKICDILIPFNYLFETGAKAMTHPLDVYVERMASKVSVQADEKTFRVPIVTQYPGITAEVEILGWKLNGLNRNSYYFKKINPAWTFNWTGITWNEPAKFRSHWAEDPNYFLLTSSEPYAFDFANYKNSYKSTSVDYSDYLVGSELDWNKRELDFISWNDIGYPKPSVDNFATTADGKFQFCLENTADGSILKQDPKENSLYPRVTHVLVLSRLSFETGTGLSSAGDVADYTTTDQNFYRYKGVFYTKKNILDALMADLGVVYYEDNQLKIPASSSSLDFNDDNFIHVYGEHLYAQVDGVKTTLYYNNAGTAAAVDAAQITLLNESLKKKASHFDGFRQGYFYYKIPIEHLSNADESASSYPTAQYGVVRNHAYTIKIGKDAGGVGTGLWDKNEPIIPVAVSGYDLSVYVQISPWTQFEQKFYFVDPSGMLVTDGQRVHRWEDIGTPDAPDNRDSDNPYDWYGNGWYE